MYVASKLDESWLQNVLYHPALFDGKHPALREGIADAPPRRGDVGLTSTVLPGAVLAARCGRHSEARA
jgi:hypothetical protein